MLSDREKRIRLVRLRREQELRRCALEPYHWLTTYAKTLDTHNPSEPVRTFPKKDYIHRMSEVWLAEQILFVMKSRQIMATWTFVALYCWACLFLQNQLVFFQSKREEDAVGEEEVAAGLLGRALVIFKHLPPWMAPTPTGPYNKLIVPGRSSMIWAVPEGGDIMRSHTASGILSDEATSQPEFRHAYTGARPTIQGGGRLTVLSSVKGREAFWNLCVGRLAA